MRAALERQLRGLASGGVYIANCIAAIAGGLGIIVGIWTKPVGVLASACLALYFAGALFTHFSRKHKVADFGAALGIFIIACITTALQLKR